MDTGGLDVRTTLPLTSGPLPLSGPQWLSHPEFLPILRPMPLPTPGRLLTDAGITRVFSREGENKQPTFGEERVI